MRRIKIGFGNLLIVVAIFCFVVGFCVLLDIASPPTLIARESIPEWILVPGGLKALLSWFVALFVLAGTCFGVAALGAHILTKAEYVVKKKHLSLL